MGLSGANKKQRIQDDPRNLRWAQDESAPGFRLLASMGWDPSSNPQLGNADSQAAIFANGGSAFSRKIQSIPLAKEDNFGIGMKRGSAAAVVGSLKAMGVPGAGLGSVQPGEIKGFVTAGSGASTPSASAPSNGGEFGGLLARLNALKAQGQLKAKEITAADDEPKKKRKRSSRDDSSDDSSSSSDDSSDDESSDEEAAPVPVVAALPPPPTALELAILKNPRMAARSKHLRAKRMATAGNSAAMAEILGLAPSPSPSSSGASTPALAIAGPSPHGFPVVPPRGSSATVAPTISSAGVGAAPMFASASTTSLSATFDPSSSSATPSTSTSAPSADKAAKRALKEAKRLAKTEKKAAKEAKRAARRAERSPSPEFKVHNAAHDPFHVLAPINVAEAPKAPEAFRSMFVGASTGGMGATFTPPTFAKASSTSLAATFTPEEETTEKVEEVKEGKKEKKEKRSKEEKAAEKAAKKAEKEASKKKEKKRDREEETEEEKKARKAEKKAKKAAKGE